MTASSLAVAPAGAVTLTGSTTPRTSWLLFAGAVVAAVGSFLPWDTVDSALQHVSLKPEGGGVVLLLGLGALVVWIGCPHGSTGSRPSVASFW